MVESGSHFWTCAGLLLGLRFWLILGGAVIHIVLAPWGFGVLGFWGTRPLIPRAGCLQKHTGTLYLESKRFDSSMFNDRLPDILKSGDSLWTLPEFCDLYRCCYKESL